MRRAVGVDFNACPQCGKRLGGGCPHCGRALQPGWNFCPYCARSTEPKRPQKRLRDRNGARCGASCRPATSPNSRSRSRLKDYYRLLESHRPRPADEMKRAFRLQIARYHPDKVQHLGQEFQAMAAERAAELTEAYRILSDDGRRAEYDRARGVSGRRRAADAAAPPADASSPRPASPRRRRSSPSRRGRRRSQFQKERASRDEFVRKATINRCAARSRRSTADTTRRTSAGSTSPCGAEEQTVFAGQGAAACSVASWRCVDRDAVVDAWAQAGKTGGCHDDEVCVLLMGSAVAPARELARAIAEQRRRQRGVRLTLYPGRCPIPGGPYAARRARYRQVAARLRRAQEADDNQGSDRRNDRL